MCLPIGYKFLLLSEVETQMCGKKRIESHVSTSTPFGLYINKEEGGGVCGLLGRGGSHANVTGATCL